ncbi:MULTISPECIES: cytochrome C [Oryzomonas]|uniref:Cytochrome C n=2 Tax=Oryzomonas TaxID=2855184 RepID=A0A5A9XB28_9BACT|nr:MULTISPECIES: cytochrome C [Oryzomonas]KAA0890352.1 cytochrome C [Oryzomonas rubra]KAB0669076.1 cytochrome C [Oryzomonas sagensis]
MKRFGIKTGLLTATAAASLALTAGTSFAAHPSVTLYTFEEIGMQMAGGAKVPVQVDANGKGMPYSPKQTCGTAGCHVKNGVDYTYDKISDHAFHSNQGRSEYVDSSTGKFDATKNKPWTQSTAMVGKW